MMTLTTHVLTPDTQAILLLSGRLGQVRGHDVQPLSPAEYHHLAQLLHSHHLRPADLLESNGLATLYDYEPVQFDIDRIRKLLNRGTALALAVETWTNRGLWIISRSDPHYPHQLRTRLGKNTPPIYYGVGNEDLLNAGGLAIVGSREIDDGAVAFTRDIATRCAHEGFQVVSGGARGVDSEAMLTALQSGGTVVGVLAESLLKAAVASKYRTALRTGHLALITAYDPEVGFNIGNAMGRNKQIYALSDYALVVSASSGHGGTWSGARENLLQQWVPLFVRVTQPMLPGNQHLIEQGGIALADVGVAREQSLALWMRAQSEQATPTPSLAETTMYYQVPPPMNQDGRDGPGSELRNEPHDLFTVVWPYLEQELLIERTDRELADLFGIELVQVRAWLQRAIERRMVRKLNKPVRYIAVTQTTPAKTLPLFP